MILVAGGSGDLGRRAIHRLVARGLDVRVLSRHPDAARQQLPPGVEVVAGNVRDFASVAAACRGVATVVSAVHGFNGSGHDSPTSIDRDGNAHLIDAAAAVRADVVLMSVVDASPTHPMELFRMKHAAEQRLLASVPRWTIIRAPAFLETWMALLEHTASGSGRPLVFGRGTNPIDFVCVEDVAAVVEQAVSDDARRGQIVELRATETLTLNELAERVQHAAGRTQKPRHVPRLMLRAMTLCARPFVPKYARFAQAALVLDSYDFAHQRRAADAEPATA